jgi:hypothetical protein
MEEDSPVVQVQLFTIARFILVELHEILSRSRTTKIEIARCVRLQVEMHASGRYRTGEFLSIEWSHRQSMPPRDRSIIVVHPWHQVMIVYEQVGKLTSLWETAEEDKMISKAEVWVGRPKGDDQ